MSESREGAIRWPARFAPECAPVHVRNELSMPVAAEAVWSWLVRAELWPSWYVNARDVRITHGPRPDLGLGSGFRWRTFGVAIASTVEELEAPERIAWSARGTGVDAYHAWLIRKTPGGCHVLTEETQHGWVARLGSVLLPNRMSHYHQIWLEALHRKAAGGAPPQP
jgi:uncharacterized protein YndB with AHSA1/START domain